MGGDEQEDGGEKQSGDEPDMVIILRVVREIEGGIFKWRVRDFSDGSDKRELTSTDACPDLPAPGKPEPVAGIPVGIWVDYSGDERWWFEPQPTDEEGMLAFPVSFEEFQCRGGPSAVYRLALPGGGFYRAEAAKRVFGLWNVMTEYQRPEDIAGTLDAPECTKYGVQHPW